MVHGGQSQSLRLRQKYNVKTKEIHKKICITKLCRKMGGFDQKKNHIIKYSHKIKQYCFPS